MKADLHVDTFSLDIQNIILYNVEFKYYPYVYAYTHVIWSVGIIYKVIFYIN
jgi:hypothetical protein